MELVNTFVAPIKVRGSDVRGPGFPAAQTPPGAEATAIVSFWKRPESMPW